MNAATLTLDNFIRSVGVNRDSPYALFLGAGASVTSGIPSAQTCVWQWKQELYRTNNPGLEDLVEELSLPTVQRRINNWLEANGYRPPAEADEYSYFIETAHPIPDDRRRFFAPWIKTARPHIGYRLLCLLAQKELFRSVWTTNFDAQVSRAAADFDLIPVDIGIDSQQRTFRQPNRGELVTVSLHGDYRYDSLKNTTTELQQQETYLASALIETLRTHSLIVSGYSGRDATIMKTLQDALTCPGNTKVYWCGYSSIASAPVAALIDAARTSGREAFYVPDTVFDEIMTRLALHCINGNERQSVYNIIGDGSADTRPRREAFHLSPGDPNALIKSNAWPIRLPSEVYSFDLVEWPKEKVWDWVTDRTAGHDVIAVPHKTILALGTIDGIRKAFDGHIKNDLQRVPVTDTDTHFDDGPIINLFTRAFVKSIAHARGLGTDGRGLVWHAKPYSQENENGVKCLVHKAAGLRLRRIGDQMYLTVDPTIHIVGSENDKDAFRVVRMRILGYQHNREFNNDLNEWRTTLLETKLPTEIDYPIGTKAFEFVVRSAPAFASIRQNHKRPLQLPPQFSRHIHHHGIQIVEPNLQFAGRSPSVTDVMPLRGLSSHGPYDAKLSATANNDRIQLAVICPRAEAPRLESFLSQSRMTQRPLRGPKEEYLIPFRGFHEEFRVPLAIPNRNDAQWVTLPEPSSALSDKEGALELSRQIREAVAAIAATGRPIVLIHIPDRWHRWRKFESDGESFNLHDFIKASCVQRGIATQFLDEDTMAYQDRCRIWWWLSVALYAKAMRTPWVLDNIDPDTAFVGLGYALNANARIGSQVVLGCSHIYNAQGQGLQFRLSRIENPIISRGNPFLPFEDARRVGETIRTLFWESHLALPRRVVIHKLTPFRSHEQKGLIAGLEGVDELEMLEINYEPTLRYVSSQFNGNSFVEGQFPVRRGTAIKLSEHEALMWIHGATDATKANWTYFQGKRRIPAPVVIRRYAGRSDLATVTTEILGLSKMDWNSGDLYGKLPSTVNSSKRIAQIAMLLDRFNTASYDYRLFI